MGMSSAEEDSEKEIISRVPGGLLIRLSCGLLLLGGVAELIAGSVVTSTSRARFVGGIYVGLAAIFSGLRGIWLRHGQASVIGTLIFGVLAVIISLVGTGLQAKMYSFLITLEACATPEVAPSTQCNTASSVYYSCSGTTSYFEAAYLCARNENNYNTNTNDDGNTGFVTCTCVTSSASPSTLATLTDDSDDGSTPSSVISASTEYCYQYNEFAQCETLLSTLPLQMQVSYLLAVLCALLASLVVSLCLLSLMRPGLFQYKLLLSAKEQSSSAPSTDTELTGNVSDKSSGPSANDGCASPSAGVVV